jgi:predicted RNA-binding protein with TRAM domain
MPVAESSTKRCNEEYIVSAEASSVGGELTLLTGAPANGGSCVAHHEGRVVFVRYALPGERVRVRVTANRGSYWHAEVVEVGSDAQGPDRGQSVGTAGRASLER